MGVQAEALPLFQSQLGSIGAGACGASWPCSPCFQSQLGSIGARQLGNTCAAAARLSIPAWFDWRCSIRNDLPLEDFNFQSQLGSIGAWGWYSRSSTWPALSIPAWFDWRSLDTKNPISPPPLSIPAWFDWRRAGDYLARLGALLSIPAWFDWRPQLKRNQLTIQQPFNPSLVRLALCEGWNKLANR